MVKLNCKRFKNRPKEGGIEMVIGRMFVDTFAALFPLYAYMLIGILLRKTGLLYDSLNKQINRLAFRVFLPASLFMSVYNADFAAKDNLTAIVFAVASYVVLFVVLILFVPRFVKDRPAAGSMVQALFRSNFVLLGLVYTRLLYGEAQTTAASIFVAVIVPLFNVLVVLDFELMRGGRVHGGKILLEIAKNPLIIASVLGAAANLSGIALPTMLIKPLTELGNAASPIMLIVIGATLTVEGFQRNGKLVAAATIGRLLVVPLIFMPIAILLGLRGVVLLTLFVAFGGPTAAASAPMAYEMGGDGELSGQITATTTLLSIGTMFLFIVALRTMGYC